MLIDETYQTSGAILLPGVPLFPNNAMPLHIFEPRYRKMLNDAHEGKGVFLVGSLPTTQNGEVSEQPIDTAVLVEIEVNQKLPDGRFILIVSGIGSVKVKHWEKEGEYPRASYETIIREVPSNADTIESLLKDSFGSYAESISMENREHLISYIESQENLEAVIDVIAQHVVSDESDRRFFLEEQSDANRASKLLLLIEDAD